MFNHDGSMMVFGGGIMWIFWLLLIIVIAFIIKTAVGSNQGSAPRPDDDPLDILKKRYARGEIDDEEFTRRRIELEK